MQYPFWEGWEVDIDGLFVTNLTIGGGHDVVLTANTNRIRAIFAVSGTSNAAADGITTIGPLINGFTRPVVTLTMGTPFAVMRYEDYGQLLTGPIAARTVGGSALDISVWQVLVTAKRKG